MKPRQRRGVLLMTVAALSAARWLPSVAIQSFGTSGGLVATESIPRGAKLREGMVGPPPELQQGQREMPGRAG